MQGSFSEEALSQFASMAAQTQAADFSEGETYDFTRCVRPNGTAYGTRGTCRKGSQQEKQAAPTGSAKPANKTAAAGAPVNGLKLSQDKVTKHEEKIANLRSKGKSVPRKLSADLKLAKRTVEHEAWKAGVNRESTKKYYDQLEKHTNEHKTAKKEHAASERALAAHKGRDKQSQIKRQLLRAQHDQNTDKLAAALDRLVRTKAAKNKTEGK